MYSFAIILHEISARAGVWGGTLGPDVSGAAALSTYLFRYITCLVYSWVRPNVNPPPDLSLKWGKFNFVGNHA